MFEVGRYHVHLRLVIGNDHLRRLGIGLPEANFPPKIEDKRQA